MICDIKKCYYLKNFLPSSYYILFCFGYLLLTLFNSFIYLLTQYKPLTAITIVRFMVFLTN